MMSDKPRPEKSRPVKSRHQPPNSTTEPPLSLPPSPNHNHPLSPNRHLKPKLSSKNAGLLRGVWPSSTPHSLNYGNGRPTTTATTVSDTTTLADYLGNDRKRDTFLSKQRSCSEFDRFEKNTKKHNNLKENHKPIFGGGSMRYTGKFRFPGRSSTSSSSSCSDGTTEEFGITRGRLSVDENKLRQRSYFRMRSGSFSDDSECSDMGSSFVTERNSPASYMSPTLSSIKSMSHSPKKSTIKNVIKKANSLSLSSKWGSLSGTPQSPTMTSRSKPPTSPSRTVKRNFLHIGLDLIKYRKTDSGCSSPLGLGMGMVENVHQMRMMHGSWMQWRYINVRAHVVNEALENKAKNLTLCAWENIVKLQQSLLQKKLQLQKDKMEMKLNLILHSQIRVLEAWQDIERRHTSNISMTKDSLEVVACKVPLIEGSKMDPQTTTISLRQATDSVASVMSMIPPKLRTTHKTVSTLCELAKVAIEEKLLLEECFEHLRHISRFEIEERSLRCSILEIASFEDQQPTGFYPNHTWSFISM